MRIKTGIVALLLALLCACANVPKDFSFDDRKQTGLVVGSVTYESGLGRYYLKVLSKETGRATLLGFGCPVWPCLHPADDKAFSEGEPTSQRGGGYAAALPQGVYRIVGWEVARGSLRSRPDEEVSIEFVVEAGHTSYLGNLHFDPDWERVQLRDRADRDLKALADTYPVVRDAPLAYRIADGVVLDHFGTTYATRLNGPIFISVSD